MFTTINNTKVSNFSELKEKYNRFISNNDTLLYASPEYLTLLSMFLKEDPKILTILDDDEEIVGAIPFIEKKGAYGTVLNSLPFYGSNGGCISQDTYIKEQLLSALENYIKSQEIVAATIINNPLVDPDGYSLKSDYVDKRIGQFTVFNEVDLNDLDQSLTSLFHYKTRNMVRKAMKSGIHVTVDNNKLDYIFNIHQENMKLIGGIGKPKSFFEDIKTTMKEGQDFNVYIASLEGKPIAGLLLLYHKKTVEYFTPVIDVNYRSYQPMSLLIYEAMKLAIKDDYDCWNWGGTWESQESVYRFKSRWGASDNPYYYYTFLNDQSIRNLSKEDLLKEYPYFFVLPFKELVNYDT